VIILSLKESGTPVGTIKEEDLRLLMDQLEEETLEDIDYYITPATIELLRERGAGEELVGVLERALGGSEGVEVSWTRS